MYVAVVIYRILFPFMSGVWGFLCCFVSGACVVGGWIVISVGMRVVLSVWLWDLCF